MTNQNPAELTPIEKLVDAAVIALNNLICATLAPQGDSSLIPEYHHKQLVEADYQINSLQDTLDFLNGRRDPNTGDYVPGMGRD